MGGNKSEACGLCCVAVLRSCGGHADMPCVQKPTRAARLHKEKSPGMATIPVCGAKAVQKRASQERPGLRAARAASPWAFCNAGFQPAVLKVARAASP